MARKGTIRFIILLSLFAVCSVVLTLVFWPFIQNLKAPEFREAFGAWVRGLGWLGVLALLGIEALQMVVAVIPGGPVQVAAGAAYGAFGGLALISAGSAVTSALIFGLVRRFGLSLLRRFFGENDLASWMFLKDKTRVGRAVFILFLIPGTPKDLLTWLTPLSGLSLPQFVVLSTLARIPAMFSSTVMGDSMIQGNWVLSLVLFLVIALVGFLGMWFRERLTGKFTKKEDNS